MRFCHSGSFRKSGTLYSNPDLSRLFWGQDEICDISRHCSLGETKSPEDENEPGNVCVWSPAVFLWERGEVSHFVNFRFALQTRGLTENVAVSILF